MAGKDFVGIALCGLGRMGSIHLPNILKNGRVRPSGLEHPFYNDHDCKKRISLAARLLYIIEADMERARQFVKEYRLEKQTKIVHVDQMKEAVSDKSVDAVVVATPTHTHEDLVNTAIEAGKHVLCEKPLAVDLKAAMECYKNAEAKGLVLLCAFNRRFDPQIQNLVQNKDKVGKLLTIKICSRDSPRPSLDFLKISGGIFHDCLVHDVDVGAWITGEKPEKIHVMAHCHDPEIAQLNDVDTVFTTLKFPSGVLMLVESQRECAFGYDQRIEIYGTKGSMTSGNPRQSFLDINCGESYDRIHPSFAGRYAEAYENEIEHLIDLIQKKISEPYVRAQDTLWATLLSQAAEDSWKESRVIDVKEHSNKLMNNYGITEYM